MAIDSKLTFKIQEIPDEKSERKITLSPEDLEFEELALKRAEILVVFEKTLDLINVTFEVEAVVKLTCDRSLDSYEQAVRGSYMVVFKAGVEGVSESENSKVKSFNLHELTLSIDQEVRDTILLGLPVKKLHPRFLDEDGEPKEFKTKVFGKTSEESSVDPRWAALKKLKN